MKIRLKKKLILKSFWCLIIVFAVSVFLTKIGGEMAVYPPKEFKQIQWIDVFYEIPRLLLISFLVSIVFYFAAYWDWIDKNNKK